MPRTTRKYPGFLKTAAGPQALALVDCMGGVLRGNYNCGPLFMTGDNTHVFIVGSGSRHGILVETFEKSSDEPGVWTSEVVFLYEPDPPGAILCAEATSHTWDPWLAAEQTGDRSLVDGPVRKRNKVRDEETIRVASARDRLSLTCVPTNGAPDSFLGVTLDEITASVKRYGESISKALPEGISAVVVPSDETRTSVMHVYKNGDETQTEVEIPDHFGIHLVNDTPYLLPCVTIEATGFGTVEGQHWQRPTTSLRCVIGPRGSVQIDTLDVGDMDFMNWYYISIEPPHVERRTFEAVVRGDYLKDEYFQEIRQLKKRAYRLPMRSPGDSLD